MKPLSRDGPVPAQDAAAALRCPTSRTALAATTAGLDSSLPGTLPFKSFATSQQFFSDASQIHPFPSVSTVADARLEDHLQHAISFAPSYHVCPQHLAPAWHKADSVNTHCRAQNPTEMLLRPKADRMWMVGPQEKTGSSHSSIERFSFLFA